MPLVGEIPPPPPEKRATRSSSRTKLSDQKAPAPSQAAGRASTLMEIAGIFQGIALMTGNFADAETIDMHGGPFLTAVAKLGDLHPEFGSTIDKAETVGPYLAVFAAATPLVLQLMANHGRIDAQRMRIGGIKDPKVLEANQKTKVMNAQAEMLREQRMAQEQAAAAQARLNEEVMAYQSMANMAAPANA